MLLELKVTNFAIIENIHIQFGSGLNILSGETGAGKSVLLKSLGLLMGAKGSIESIRTGNSQASVEGSFDLTKRKDLVNRLKDQGIEVDDNILVVRRVLSDGKSRVYLNGVLATLSGLRELVAPLVEVAGATAPLIEMTGQHENKNLLSKSYHLDLLDQYVGAFEVRGRYQKKHAQWASLNQEIARFERESQDKSQRLDFLRYQRDEIVALELSPGEDVEIENEFKVQKNSARIVGFIEFAEQALDGQDYSAVQAIQKVVTKAQELQNIDASLLQKSQNLIQAKALIEDSLYEMRSHISKVEGDPNRLDKLEEKLSAIRKLQKKFGPTVDDILKSLVELETEIGHLENSDVHLQEMIKQRDQLSEELWKLGNDLHKRRASGSKLLADSVNDELKDLNMKGVSFHVEVQRLQDLSATGLSDVEFQSQTSARDPKRALSKVASGGELSRILLSLKRVVGSGGQPRTYLFDEVDTGVSGPTAEKVGKKLRSIAKDQQVICVTHLPQVAAFADIHFFIQKSPNRSSVAMEVSKLLKKEKIEEIARLISGQKVTKTSLAHAEVLLKQAQS